MSPVHSRSIKPMSDHSSYFNEGVFKAKAFPK